MISKNQALQVGIDWVLFLQDVGINNTRRTISVGPFSAILCGDSGRAGADTLFSEESGACR